MMMLTLAKSDDRDEIHKELKLKALGE